MVGGVTVILSSFAFNDSSSSILKIEVDQHDLCYKNTIFCYFAAAILIEVTPWQRDAKSKIGNDRIIFGLLKR